MTFRPPLFPQLWLCTPEHFLGCPCAWKARRKRDREGKVEGYGLSFNTAPEENPGAPTGRPHLYRGETAGVYLAPGDPHDSNHGAPCRQLYGWKKSCVQLAGANLNAHEQTHAEKKRFLRMLHTMGFGRFAFMAHQ